ncbi:MAG: hypothetical protein J0L56_20490 [Chitinophagales bacterium]|nr:hypothetical protein [Chitinophagales bacterium]
MSISTGIKHKYLSYAEVAVILVLASVPLFVTFPYRVNIFLSWEGAYRVSEGQIPFRDFGTPLGGMYWVIPGIFFKIFGAQMITLVKAQVFINILSGLAFRSILNSFRVNPGIKFSAVLLFCLSYSFFNFWPWYNHTVIVYEFIAIAFLLKALMNEKNKFTIPALVLSAFFTVCSFFTKQDAGALTFLLCAALVFFYCVQYKRWKYLFIYGGGFVLFMAAFIIPLSNYGFSYWFNHGQAPHSGRISAFEIANDFFSGSQWLKFYLFIIGLLLVLRFRSWKECWNDKANFLFLLLTLGIIAEAAIFQVTSYTPPDNNIFYHSFAIAYILTLLSGQFSVDFSKVRMVVVCLAGILLWWSNVYWKYFQRIAERSLSNDVATVSPTGENVVNKRTFIINNEDTADIPLSQWTFSPLKSFHKIYMPAATVDGMSRLLNMDMVKQGKSLRVLNMTELTPLAKEMPFELEKGSHYPLWYHLGVAMFNKQAEMFEERIGKKEYDLVLFEHIPSLNNFYPFRVRDSLLRHYNKVDSFPAPRQGETRGVIEVFTK